MTSTILECSQKNSYNESSNSESNWKNSFQNEVSLEDGDTLQMKMCLINTQAISSTNIIIKTDTTVPITFCVYEKCVPPARIPFADDQIIQSIEDNKVSTLYNSAYTAVLPENTTPTGIYLVRGGADDGEALIEYTVNISIPAGSYPPDAIAGLITSGLKGEFDQSTTNFGTCVMKMGDDQRLVSVVPNVPATMGKSFKLGLITVDFDVGLPAFTCRRNIGASTVLFEYVDTAFQFSYLHSPIFSEKNGTVGTTAYTTPGVSVFGEDGQRNEIEDQYGGVMLTKLEPAAFWNQLGFTDSQISDITFNDSIFNGLPDGQRAAHLKQRTAGINSNLTFQRGNATPFNSSILLPTAAAGNLIAKNDFPQATTELRPLRASNPYTVDNIGFYRIECVANFESEYLVPNQRLGAVTGIVSKNYNTNDFITGYGGDSALAYTHSGETLALNNMNIRIIDPKTEKEAEQLGPNSTVFLELIKAPPKPAKK